MSTSSKIKYGLSLIFMCFCIKSTEAQCNVTNRFGPDCEFKCHCMNNRQCDRITGDCHSGCDFEWVGPACQRRNIRFTAATITANHNSNIQPPQYAPLAVDRNLSKCSITNNNTNTPWWRLWLPSIYHIRNISILTGIKYLDNFRKFQVMVENNTARTNRDGYSGRDICYTYSDTRLPSRSVDIACSKTLIGNQIRIQLAMNNVRLVLCDVRIYGECDNGTYGESCTEKCSNHCKDICNKDRGACASCKHGWTGSHCNKVCEDGKYGENCTFDCSPFCRNRTACRKTDGICVNGCVPGYRTEKCIYKCKNGTYGENCTSICSTHCLNGTYCIHTNGSCGNGCDPGWTGGTCKDECKGGTYGPNCASNCSEHCLNDSVCMHTNGSCANGCDPGWTGNKCLQECEDGEYGENCYFNCSGNCRNDSVCSKVDGSCAHGCKAGFTGNDCSESCINGTHGQNCSFNCSGHCVNSSICRSTDGHCLSGCEQGWTGHTCDDKCQNGLYGANCSSSCSTHCMNGTVCAHTNGTCLAGCDPGWTGDTCTDECSNGTYGTDCSTNCSTHCFSGSACLHTNGSCVNGCLPGWIGDSCQEEGIAESEQQAGEDDVTEGVLAAIVVVIVIAVVVVAVCFWQRTRFIEKFNSIQVWYHSHTTRDENSFQNGMYINENVAPECMANDNADHATFAQNTDPVYANTDFVDSYLNDVKGSQLMSASAQLSTKSNECTAPNEVEYDYATPTHSISLSELEHFLKEKGLIQGYFQSQFETIPTGLLYPANVAERRRNIHKNRFKKIYPYDHSRVKLKEIPGQPDSDYINANVINSPGRNKAYIASQGPVKENVDDFWRMIWEMNVKTVVMATNLVENGKMKCIQYWGTKDEVVPYGQINVTMKAEKVYAELTIREFSMFHQEDVRTKRDVTQFHYTAWPDKGVPKISSSLLHFWRKVRQNDGNKAHTWLVHCSAGVGRTGTFLALDILFDQGEQTGFIDVYQCVKDLREQRVNLVQTNEQYILLHKLMLEMFCLPSKPVNVHEFTKKYHQLQEKHSSKSGKSKLFIEYETLESDVVWPVTENNTDENSGEAMDTSAENEGSRPILSTYVPGCTNDIKAVYIPSYFDQCEFIIAQFHPEFKMETCRLVFEKDISLVVTLPTKQGNDYFEQSASENTPFVVICKSQIQKGEYIIKDYVLHSQNKKHCFKEIIFKCWSPKSFVPDNPEAMLNLVNEIDLQRQPLSAQAYGRKSVLLQCSNGVDRSGLVAVLLNVLDRARVDNEVSIPQIVRQLRHNRKEIIANFEQYKFCYDVLNCHLESNATYANV